MDIKYLTICKSMEKNNERGIRLQRSRQLRKLSQTEFGKKIESEQPYVAKMEKSGGFSYEQAERFAEILQINADWLYFGYGDQFDMSGEPSIKKNESDQKGVPFYDIEVTGSLVRSFSDANARPEFFIDFPPFNDCTAWLPIVGDSMFPRFQAGEMVGIKQIFNMESILWGEPHLVITNEEHDNLRTVKTVHEHNDPEKIILRASNPQFKGDTIIYKKNILSIYIIKGQAKKSQY